MYAHFLIFIIISTNVRCEEDLKFRIGLPEYICDKDGGIRDVSKDMTTIRLLGKDAQSVSYKFGVNFNRVGDKCNNNQRCTLIVWRAVRELENYLKNYPTEQLQNGLIQINNSMFIPGVKYILNVTVINDGNVLEEKQLTLNYVDEDVKKSIKKPMASLLLLGPETSYAYTTYVINAELTICSNITSYHFNWELSDESGNTTLLPSKGAELKIPPDTFQSLQTYIIKSDLVAEGGSIANAQQTVKILSKGLLLQFPFKSLTTRTNQPIRLRPYIKDLNNIDGEIRLSWSCINTVNNEECEYQSDTSELEMDSGFESPGKYKISLEISKSEFAETASCIVEVMDDVPITEIEEIEFPTNPSAGIEIHATIYDLKTFCTLQWTSIDEDGYEFLDFDSIPGNIATVINVTTKEDLFLYELEEFSNGTVDKRHNLIIPPPSESWEGLKGDAKYLFRLIIKCPPPTDDNFQEVNETASVPSETELITLMTDVIVETNGPPQIQQLDVKPAEGDAFKTLFSFKTQKARDKPGDEPILYKFGYILDNRDMILWNLGDVTNCEATLPYSKDGIQTFLECCDNFNSCSRVLGPVIKTKLPKEMSILTILQKFARKMKSEDYSKAFIEAFGVLHSYSYEENPEQLTTARNLILGTIDEEIDKFMSTENNNDNRWKSSVNELMRNVNDFSSQLQLSETILNKLIDLRNKLSDESENYTQRKLLSYERVKRSNSLSLQDVRNYIEVSELIITSSTDSNKINLEKENLRKQLFNYMENLCLNIKNNKLQLELKTLILSVEKLNRNSLNNFIHIPFEGNSWQTIARIKIGGSLENFRQKCIGKVLFRDYLGKSGIIYFVDILHNSEMDKFNDIIIYLPKNKSLEGNPHCIVYRNGWHSDCKVMQNIANYVKCSCKYLGYYYLEYNHITTEVPSSMKIIPTTPVSIVTEKILSGNESLARTYEEKPRGQYESISYIVIVASIIGIIILTVILRKIFHDDDDSEESETFEFPKYAQLHNEEFLNDAHM